MAAPTLARAGAGLTFASGNSDLTLTGVTVGDLVIVQALGDGAGTDPTCTAVSGIQKLNGTSGVDTVVAGAGPAALGQSLWFGRATATTVTVNISTTGDDIYANIYSFAGVNPGSRLADVVENGSYGNVVVSETGTSTTVTDCAVTTLGDDRLALNFVAINDDNATASFTGQTGGTWAEAVTFGSATGTDGAVQLQTATLASPGTINGGSFTMAASDSWGVIGFALLPVQTPSWEQKSFRFRNDDGNETSATWMAAANANVSVAIDGTFRLRVLIQNDAASSVKLEPSLQYRKNGGSWVSVGATIELADVRTEVFSLLADGTNSTQQLGAGTFQAGKLESSDPTALTPSSGDILSSRETEYEWCLNLDNDLGGLTNGDVLDFRVVNWTGTATPFSTYTQTPTVTVGSAGVAVAAVLAGTSGGGKALGVTKPLAAVVTATSGGGKALVVAKPLAAALAGVGVGSGTRSLGVTKPLAAVLPGSGAVAAVLGLTKQLAAAVAGSSSVTAAVGVAKQLVAALPGQGSTSGDLSVTSGGVAHALSAVLAGAGAITAPLGALKPLVASVGGSGAVTAPLGLAKYVVAQLNGVGAIAAPLGVAKQLLAALGGQGATSGNVQQLAKPLAASTGGTGGAVSTLTNTKLVSAVLSGASGAVSTVTNSKTVSAVLSSSGATSAQLAVQKNLNAVLDGAVSVMASLTVGLGDLAPKLRRMMGVGE